MTFYFDRDTTLCMTGKIRTIQKCPKCGGPFEDTERGLVCPDCLITPIRYFIDLFWKGQRLKIYSDRDGHSLDSYRRAQRLIEAMRHEIDEKRFNPEMYIKSRLRIYQFSEYAVLWLREYERRLKQKRLSPYYLREVKRYVRDHYLPFFEDMDIREVRSADIKVFADGLPEHLSLKTQKNILDILHKLFSDAHADDYVESVPKFPRISPPGTYRAWIDEVTQDALFELIPDPHKPIIMFMMRQAVRPGEARALQWHDIDFDNDFVVIRRVFSLDEIREHTKNKDIRVIPLDSDMKEVLLSMPTPLNRKDFVFKCRGKPYSEGRARKVWKAACRKLDLEDVTLYGGTRHSLASQAVNRGVDYRTVGKLLGHKNPQQTERYAQMKTEGLKTVLRKNDRPYTVRTGKVGDAKLLNIKKNND